MGVQGLWQLLEPAGKPVDVHSLKGKVLAVDASIWLHQLVKGFRDKDGNPVPNAHLLGVFYRICKLLSYGVKPVFVFDGGVPVLKRQTLASRRKRKLEALDKSEEARQKMLSNYVRQQLQRQTKQVLPAAVEEALQESNSPRRSPTKKVRGDRFDEMDQELIQFREKFATLVQPEIDRVDRVKVKRNEEEDDDSSDSDDDTWAKRYGMDYAENFGTIASKDFDALPLEMQHEILFEMQESRKMNSWAKMERMPSTLQAFSSYQMDKLRKRRFLQKKIQSVQQEMGQRHIHVQNLDELLQMDYNFDSDDVVGSQEKGLVLIKKGARKKVEASSSKECSQDAVSKNDEGFMVLRDSDSDWNAVSVSDQKVSNTSAARSNAVAAARRSIGDMEEEEQLALAMELSLQQQHENNWEASELKKVVLPTHGEVSASTRTNVPERSLRKEASTVIFPSAASSCSKFLDTVGFPSKVSTSTLSDAVNISTSENSSESDDDFEDVVSADHDPSAGVPVPDTERAMVADLISRSRDLIEDSRDDCLSIDIVKVVSEKPAPEEDIFADIFNDAGKRDAELQSEGQDSGFLKSSEELDLNDEWDSEPLDMAQVKELEQQASSSQSQRVSSLEAFGNVEKEERSIIRTWGNLPQKSKPQTTMLTAEYMQAQEKLNRQQATLQQEKGFQERVASSITGQISLEAQELLGIFGIPYVVSPMEAESQCAFLDTACLTDGTITDDSDCWLFGSRRVYKNFYASGRRHLEFYQLADIINTLNLDREKLVLIAMLTGADYCDGIDGVGPVTALEILSEFHCSDVEAFEVLNKFREWWDLINDPNVVVPPDLSKIRDKLRKLTLSPGFPNRTIYDAYMNPEIDSSLEPFRWGKPDVNALYSYTNKKFGWTKERCDSMLLPVMKHLEGCPENRAKQLTLDTFLVSNRYELPGYKGRSKRLRSALQKLKRTTAPVGEVPLSSESSSDDEEKSVPNKTKIQQSKSKAHENNILQMGNLHSSNSSTSAKTIEEINQSLHRPVAVTPQKMQEETRKAVQKRKAIKILKSKSIPK